MPFEGFTEEDYDVFEIPTFAERMAAIRSSIRPKLVELGAEMAERMRPHFGPEFYAHVASHMRRRVNPPPDTWVAFGPSRKGYKAHPHLSIGIGAKGPYVEFIVMDEAPEYKTILSGGLKRHAGSLAGCLQRLDEISLHLDHHSPTAGFPAEKITQEAIERMAEELARLKGNEFMVAWPFARHDERVRGRNLVETADRAFRSLQPIYDCSLDAGR